MPQCKTRAGKTVVGLYEREKRRIREVVSDLEFVARNAIEESGLQKQAKLTAQSLVRLIDELCPPEQADEPAPKAKAPAA